MSFFKREVPAESICNETARVSTPAHGANKKVRSRPHAQTKSSPMRIYLIAGMCVAILQCHSVVASGDVTEENYWDGLRSTQQTDVNKARAEHEKKIEQSRTKRNAKVFHEKFERQQKKERLQALGRHTSHVRRSSVRPTRPSASRSRSRSRSQTPKRKRSATRKDQFTEKQRKATVDAITAHRREARRASVFTTPQFSAKRGGLYKFNLSKIENATIRKELEANNKFNMDSFVNGLRKRTSVNCGNFTLTRTITESGSTDKKVVWQLIHSTEEILRESKLVRRKNKKKADFHAEIKSFFPSGCRLVLRR